MNMKSFENKPKIRQNNEETWLKSAEALEEERGILGRFKGKAKSVANLMLLVSALSVAPGVVNEAYAQAGNPTNKTEQVQAPSKQAVEKIDESKLTESGKWARNIVEAAKKDLSKIKTAEDANWLIRDYFGQFVFEYYMPTKGQVEEGAYGTKSRVASGADLELILQEAKEMKTIIDYLNKKFGIEAYGNRSSQINDVILKATNRASYAGQKQSEILKRALEKYK